MFASIIQYRLNPIFESDFLKLWKEQYNFLRGAGAISTSFLHKETKLSYIAYTRWESKELFEEHIINPAGFMHENFVKMEECCNSITIPFRMQALQNLEPNG